MKNAVCLFCLFLLHTATAQVYKHRSFATADGLSSTTIYHALQDRKGYLWFGTDAGVTRFDGTHFKQYYKDNGLSDNDVIHLFGGKTNRVFFATYNGRLSFFDNDKFANPSNTAFLRQAAFNYALVAGFEDGADNIWLGTKDGSIYRLNKNGVQPFGKKSSKKGDAAHFFQQDSQGQIWIDGNYKIDKDTIAHTRLRYTFVGSNAFYVSPQGNESIFLTEDGLITMRDTVQSLLIPIKNIAQPFFKEYGYLMRDAQQNIWLPTLGDGVYCYLYENQKYATAPIHYLRDSKVTTVLQDHERNYWFALLGEGLYMLPANYQSAVNYTYADGLSYNRIDAVLKDGAGNVWLGMEDATINILRPNHVIDRLKIRLPPNTDASNQSVLRLHTDPRGRVWAMTQNAIAVFTRKGANNWQQQTIPTADQKQYTYKAWTFAADGTVYIAHARGILRILPAMPRCITALPLGATSNQPVTYSVFADADQHIWVSNAKGLHQKKGDSLVSYTQYDTLLREKIKSLAQMPDGTMVLAAEGFGLFFLNKNKLTQRLTRNDSLPDNIFKRLLVRDSIIWCTGNHGLTRLVYGNGKVQQMQTLRTSEGLVSDEVNDVFADSEKVYVATAKGLTILAANPDITPIAAPRVFITTAPPHDSTHATAFYPDNNYVLTYGAIAFRDPETVAYQYRFTDREAWTDTRNTTLSLAQLRPGSYRFEVRARHLHSAWGIPDGFAFTVLPFWYQTWWFALLLILLGAAALVYVVQWRIGREQHKQTERLQAEKKMTELEQQALQSMMNPHFIFNVLNSVQYFLNQNNKEAANRYLTQFARMLRTNLEYSNKPKISIEEEFRYLNLYLSLEQLRCGEKLTYHLTIDDDLDAEYVYLPPMLLQPYVENAIWHGIMPMPNGGTITLHAAEKTAGVLTITITDTGIGIDNSKQAKADNPSQHHSLALTLTSERLRIMTDLTKLPHTVAIRQLTAEGGTQITLQLPCDEA